MKRIIDRFRNLAWSEVKPEHLNYPYCQILLIGEDIEKAVEPTKKDQKHDKETPKEELEKLEHEDELRVEHLNGQFAFPHLHDPIHFPTRPILLYPRISDMLICMELTLIGF